MPTTITANSRHAVIAKAILAACKPCCGAGSGVGSGSGIRVPCGCAGCDCCPGVCWWATNWHKSWITDSPKYATGFGPGTYSLSTYSMTLVSNPDDYYYLGDVGSTPTDCTIAGAFPVGGTCSPGSVLHILTGTVAWTLNVAPFTVYSYTVDYYLDLTISWACGGDTATFTYAGLYLNGIQYVPGSDPTFDSFATTADYAIASNDVGNQSGVSTASCSFAVDTASLRLPAMSIIALT